MPRREDETSPRPKASGPPPEDRILSPHLDEGTAHAWLDGALPPDEAARAAAHVAGCAVCAALVAEAQGLLAGASRILGALDEVPGGVLPRDAAREAARDAALSAALAAAATERRDTRRDARGARRAWYAGVPLRAAAAVLLVAGLGTIVVRSGDQRASRMSPMAAASDRAASAPAASSSSSGPSATLDVSSAGAAPQAEQRPRDVLPTAQESAAATRAREVVALARVQDMAGAAASVAASAHARPLPRAEDAQRFEARRAVSNDVLARPDSQPMATPRAPMPSPAPAAAGVQGGLARMREGGIAGRITTPPLAASALAREAAGTDSLASAARLDGAVEEALRRRATRLLTALGCHTLTPDAGGGAVPRPTQLTLLEATASRRAGRQSYVARIPADGTTGEWTPLDGDSLRVAWTVARGSVVVRLSAPTDGAADVRRGFAQIVDAQGVPGTRQPVTARRVACRPDPRR